MERLKNLKDRVENGSILSKSEKDYIKKKYVEITGKKLVTTKSGCKDCYRDALIEMLVFSKSDEWQMKNGAVITHNGTIFTKVNITQEIIIEFLKDDKHKDKFYKNGLQ